MSKKVAVVIATTVLGLVVSTSIAIALNIGILDRTSPTEQVAAAAPVTTEASSAEGAADVVKDSDSFRLFPKGTKVVTVYVDEPAPAVAPQAFVPTAPGVPAQPAAQPAAPPATRKAPKTPAPVPTTAVEPPTQPAPAPTPIPAPTATAPPAPEPTATPVTVPSVTYPTYTAGSAGDIALAYDGSTIVFWGAYPNSGWQYSVEDDGPRKVKVKFRRVEGEEGEVEWKAELKNGEIRIEVGD